MLESGSFKTPLHLHFIIWERQFRSINRLSAWYPKRRGLTIYKRFLAGPTHPFFAGRKNREHFVSAEHETVCSLFFFRKKHPQGGVLVLEVQCSNKIFSNKTT